MIKKYNEGKLAECTSLIEELHIERKNPVISITGAGGKTTTVSRLAGEYRKRHIPVIVTTTTHMLIEAAPWFVLEPSMDQALEVLDREGMVWLGIPAQGGKMKAPPESFFKQLLQTGYPVLIEADGAKRLPLKAPAEHEPVILKETTHVLYICGLDAVGQSIQDVCFRPELAAGILGKRITDPVRPEDILNLALSPAGGRKGILPAMKYHMILNKADTREREQTAKDICTLAAMRGMTDILVTASE